MNEERCDKCGDVGHDRRTLWMSCFYQMEELGIPFDEQRLENRHFYTLRVCKSCRAYWMSAIKQWFFCKMPEAHGSTGVFVRELGASRELTPEEIEERWPKLPTDDHHEEAT